MKSIAHSLFILVVFASLSACTTVRQPTLPKNSGNYGEIIAVAPEVVWNTSVGDLLREKAALPLFGLPQPEPMFNVVELKEQGFNGLYKTHRNILKIEINPANKPSVQVNKNIYAREQAFILIKAPDLDALHQIIIDRLEQILWLFHDEEIERLKIV